MNTLFGFLPANLACLLLEPYNGIVNAISLEFDGFLGLLGLTNPNLTIPFIGALLSSFLTCGQSFFIN